VHVIYAGTGPFAALALPVMLRFAPEAVQFTLLEVNPWSFEKLQLVIRELGLGPHVKLAECCDATAWRVPDESVDIVISETMNRALQKEPQAGIMLNLSRQLDDSVIFIPESISVSLGWQQGTSKPPEDLVEILKFDGAERRRILERTELGGEWAFTPVIWRHQPRPSARLVYWTSIRVFEEEALNHNDCSLTMTERVSPSPPLEEARLRFQYRTSAAAGFEVRTLAIQDLERGE